MRAQRGVILITVMWIILILSIISFSLAASVRVELASSQQSFDSERAFFMAKGQALYAALQSGSLADIVRANSTDGPMMKSLYLVFTGRLWITFGCFLLGVCAWRARLFEDSDASRKFFRRVLVVGGSVAVATIVITLTVEASSPLSSAWLGLTGNVQKMALAASYVAAVTLWYWRHSTGALGALAPLGKMGLTTYLLQSVFLAMVFYGAGLGMMGKIGCAAAAAIGVVFFVAQVFMARWWLERWSMGPVEWLWRSATQLRWQPLGKESVALAR